MNTILLPSYQWNAIAICLRRPGTVGDNSGLSQSASTFFEMPKYSVI